MLSPSPPKAVSMETIRGKGLISRSRSRKAIFSGFSVKVFNRETGKHGVLHTTNMWTAHLGGPDQLAFNQYKFGYLRWACSKGLRSITSLMSSL